MSKYDVVTIGAAVLDVIVRSSEFKVMKSHEIEGGVALCEVYGGKTEVDMVDMTVGGGATNAAVSLLKKGVKVGSVFKVADDDVGKLIVQHLEEEGLDLSLMIKAETGRSAISVVLLANQGGRSILTSRGVGKEIDSSEIEWKKLAKAEWLMIASLGGKMALIEDLIYFAKSEGVKVMWNPGKRELEESVRLRKLVPQVEVLVMNRMELARLGEVSFEDQEEIDRRANELRARYVVVTEGSKGSVMYEKGRKVRVEAFKVPKVVDETGAGDAYNSGLVYGLLQEWPFVEVMKTGAANAAGMIQKVGAKGGVLKSEEIEEWMKKDLRIVEEKL